MATMFKWNFYAVESVSGDVIQGYVYDNAGTYFDGYSHTFGNDQIGGNWTYHVTDHTVAPGGAVAGYVYDTSYYDGETHSWGDGSNELHGSNSGTSGLGSEVDSVQFYNGGTALPVTQIQLFGAFDINSGHQAFYEADKSGNQNYKYGFYATESVSGDVIQGYTYDSAANYYIGWQQTFGTDSLGGNWTYHVTDKTAVNIPAALDGFVYDTSYYDAATQAWADGYNPLHGNQSGDSGIGSDNDYAQFYDRNGVATTITDVNHFGAAGLLVADQSGLLKFNFYAVESATGDVIQGYTYGRPGSYFDGFTRTLGSDEANGSWTYHVTGHENTGVTADQAGYVYDTLYYNAQTGKWADTKIGATGTEDGTHGLGSEYDYAQFYNGNAKLPIDSVYGLFGGGGYYVADLVAAGATVYKYDFYAVESASGDIIQGYVYDNSSNLFDGYSHTFGTDEAGGSWSYHVTDHTAAPGGALAGRVYDVSYYDGETRSWGDGYNVLHGGYSGTLGLGSDRDLAQFYNGNTALPISNTQEFGYYSLSTCTQAFYEADKSGATIYKYGFYATESVSGDVIQGYVYDSTGNYSVGWQHTYATDNLGGNWTYHVTDATAVNVSATLDQMVYDTSYYDAATKTWADGFYASRGTASGASGLGSDADFAQFYDRNGAAIATTVANKFGADGQFVADQSGLQKFNFYAAESATGDVIQGYVYARPGVYFDGFSKTLASDETNGAWTYHITDHENTGVGADHAGFIYDTSYYDVQTGKWADTYLGAQGAPSGRTGIGSDSDFAQFYNGNTTLPLDTFHGMFGGSGYYVADLIT